MTKTPVKSMTKVYHYFDRPQRNAWVDYPEPDKPVLQGAALECDINRVVARLKQGLDPGVQLNQGVYRDNTGIPDMKTNLDVIRSHESAFADLPDAIRQKFRSPLEYYEAQQKKALEESARTSVSLDVTGPTDSKLAVKTKRELKPMKRKPMPARVAKKTFKRSTAIHPKNSAPAPKRGGYRL